MARSLPVTAPVAGGRGSLEPGRDQAVDVLFRRHYAGLLRLAYCILGERSRAEDVVQDAFVSLYSHWGGLRDREAAGTYLRSAVINRCRSQVRDLVRQRARQLTSVEPTRVTTELVPGEDGVDGAEVAEAVRGLSRRQREVVVCRYYLDLSVAETAAVLEITVGAVKRHAHRALETLATRLEEQP